MTARNFTASLLLLLFTCIVSSPRAYAVIAGKDLLTGKNLEITPGAKGTVAIFLSAKCPCSNSHLDVVKKLSNEFKDFTFVAIHSNSDEPVDLAKSYFKMAALPFPVIQDEKNKLADQLKALKTPHAFLLNTNDKVLYQGGVTSSSDAKNADQNFLREALADVSAGRNVKVAESRTLGCAISRGEKHVW